MICIDCKHGHTCPHTGDAGDMLHLLIDYANNKNAINAENAIRNLQTGLTMHYSLERDFFDLGVDLIQCKYFDQVTQEDLDNIEQELEDLLHQAEDN